MALPRTTPPAGVTSGVWVNDYLRRLENIVNALDGAPMTLLDMERLERALVKAHVGNQLRVTAYLETHTAPEEQR